jgi:hypothetical protein
MPRQGGLLEALDEVLDLGIPHRLGRLIDVHHHGPLEVRHGAGYGVDPVIVDQGAPIAGDVGELAEEQ